MDFFLFWTILYANAFLFKFVFWFVFNFLGMSSIFICRIWNIAFFSKMEMRCICYMMYLPFSVACLNLWYNWLLRTSNAWLKPMNNTLFRIEDVYKLLRCVYILTFYESLTFKTHRIENQNVKYSIAYQLIICYRDIYMYNSQTCVLCYH